MVEQLGGAFGAHPPQVRHRAAQLVGDVAQAQIGRPQRHARGDPGRGHDRVTGGELGDELPAVHAQAAGGGDHVLACGVLDLQPRGQLAQVDGAGGELVLGDGDHDVLLGRGRHPGVGAPGGPAGCGGAWLARAVDGARAGPRARSIGVRPPAPLRLPGRVEGRSHPIGAGERGIADEARTPRRVTRPCRSRRYAPVHRPAIPPYCSRAWPFGCCRVAGHGMAAKAEKRPSHSPLIPVEMAGRSTCRRVDVSTRCPGPLVFALSTETSML